MATEPSIKTKVSGPNAGCFIMKLVGGAGLIAVLALAKGFAKIAGKGADDVIKAVGKSTDDVGRAASHGAPEIAPAPRSGTDMGGALAHGAARGTARGAARGMQRDGEDDEKNKNAPQLDGVHP